jgi:hypothetical protein
MPDPAHKDRLTAVAKVWQGEIDEIISLMFRYTEEKRHRLRRNMIREEAIFELAKLMLWLSQLVVTKKLQEKKISELDPATEASVIFSQLGRERIENTARIFAEHIWIKLHDKWQGRISPLVDSANQHRKKRRKLYKVAGKTQITKKQHYSPDFTNRYWVNSKGEIRVFSRNIDGTVTSRLKSCSKWGFEYYIYPERLEQYFSRIESDAKVSYDKLLKTIPLTPLERQRWVTFLIVQSVRTPAFILKLTAGLKKLIETSQMEYPTSPESLVRAYETLFQNDKFYATTYQLIASKAWLMARAAPGSFFIKPDEPAVISGSESKETWSLVFPLSPTKCFLAGPSAIDNRPPVVPHAREFGKEETDALNEMLAFHARREVITLPSNDNADFRELLERSLANGRLRNDATKNLVRPYWGSLVQ